jgi:hypothetical protein
MRKRKENGTNISGFWGSGFRGFKCQTSKIQQLLNFEKERKVELIFQDFGVRVFRVSNTKQQHTKTPELRKRKECGTCTSGFQGLGKQGNFA